MIHVVVGTDSYGRVKAVGKTAVVTTFSMVQSLPFGPLESYSVWGPATSETEGVPFFAQVRKVTLCGVPLARVDRTSVAFAYARAVLAVLVIFGFIGTFMGLILSREGRELDDFGRTAIQLAEACLVTGVVGGVLTYLVPTAGRRERAIRTYCGEMLGVCIDPGRVAPAVADAIREALPQPDDPKRASVPRPRTEHVRELILTRCDAATGPGDDCEAMTDELLDQLRHLDGVAFDQAVATEPPHPEAPR